MEAETLVEIQLVAILALVESLLGNMVFEEFDMTEVEPHHLAYMATDHCYTYSKATVPEVASDMDSSVANFNTQ